MKRNLKEMGFATHIDLFSNTCEPIAPLAPPTKWINEVKKRSNPEKPNNS